MLGKWLNEEKNRLTIIALFLGMWSFLYLNAQGGLSEGVVKGECSKYIKDFQYVNGVEVCPVTFNKSSIEVISPVSIPKTINSKISFTEWNGFKDLSILLNLVLPVFIGISQIPIIYFTIVMAQRGLKIAKSVTIYKNFLFYIFLFLGTSSTISTLGYFFI